MGACFYQGFSYHELLQELLQPLYNAKFSRAAAGRWRGGWRGCSAGLNRCNPSRYAPQVSIVAPEPGRGVGRRFLANLLLLPLTSIV